MCPRWLLGPSQYDTSSLRRVSGGGAATAPKMVAEMAKSFKTAAPGQVGHKRWPVAPTAYPNPDPTVGEL